MTPAAKEAIVEESYDPAFGARPLRRYVQHSVETLIGRKILSEDIAPGTTMTVDFDGEKLYIR
jgi:ATP-dependent Clp protease ATP-binding subunit ClpB